MNLGGLDAFFLSFMIGFNEAGWKKGNCKIRGRQFYCEYYRLFTSKTQGKTHGKTGGRVFYRQFTRPVLQTRIENTW